MRKKILVCFVLSLWKSELKRVQKNFYICRYPPEVLMACRYFANRQGFYTQNLKMLTCLIKAKVISEFRIFKNTKKIQTQISNFWPICLLATASMISKMTTALKTLSSYFLIRKTFSKKDGWLFTTHLFTNSSFDYRKKVLIVAR